ncbi:MAG: gamma-glutamyl-gamma-aminobutyrate hydrolase family protein [Candidatus Melainabacteria bacterium]|nr:gamma-glutamyl-gamma-aminobutyrate hydrolase family protein [Candidatus Melainabacteria bacterium]
MKPLIGINLDIQSRPLLTACIQATYYEAIQKAGGIPVLIPPMSNIDLEQLLGNLHGLMLIGGRDYSAHLYGEPIEPTCELIHLTRQEFDLRLVKTTLTGTHIPLLGICGGCQLLNISLGGSLMQDIQTTLPNSSVVHSKPNGNMLGYARHSVRVNGDSLLGQIYSTQVLDVPTSHHQAIKVLGAGLKAVAYADDGIIEAVEKTDRPFTVGLQWHPERDLDGNKTLFQEFVFEATKHTVNKPSKTSVNR